MNKKVVIFTVATFTLVALAVLDYKNNLKESKQKEVSSLAFPSQPEVVKAVKIANSIGEFKMIKVATGWELKVGELTYQASEQQVVGLLRELTKLKIYPVASHVKANAAANSIEVSTDTDKFTWAKSTQKTFDGGNYLLSQDKVFRSEKPWEYYFESNYRKFIDKLVVGTTFKVSKLSLVSKANTFQLHKDDSWKLIDDDHALEMAQVEKYITGIEGLKADNVIIEGDALFEKILRLNPAKQLVISNGKESLTLMFVELNDTTYIKKNNSSVIFKISNSESKKINWQAKDFYSLSQPFALQAKDFNKLIFKTSGKVYSLLNADKKWTATGLDIKLNQFEVKDIANQLSQMQAVGYFATNKKLPANAVRISVYNNETEIFNISCSEDVEELAFSTGESLQVNRCKSSKSSLDFAIKTDMISVLKFDHYRIK